AEHGRRRAQGALQERRGEMLQAASPLRRAGTNGVHRGRRNVPPAEACGARARRASRRGASRMTDRVESRITECAAYLRVDFGSSDCSELFETYRSFADLCNGRRVNGALLMAGDNAPEGHRELHEALSSMARTIALQPEFKLAMVASTPAVKAVYREAQRASR